MIDSRASLDWVDRARRTWQFSRKKCQSGTLLTIGMTRISDIVIVSVLDTLIEKLVGVKEAAEHSDVALGKHPLAKHTSTWLRHNTLEFTHLQIQFRWNCSGKLTYSSTHHRLSFFK